MGADDCRSRARSNAPQLAEGGKHKEKKGTKSLISFARTAVKFVDATRVGL